MKVSHSIEYANDRLLGHQSSRIKISIIAEKELHLLTADVLSVQNNILKHL